MFTEHHGDLGVRRRDPEDDRLVLAGGSPVVLDAPEGTVLKELLAEVGRWAGAPRNLAMGGFTDPSLTERTGLPLVEPFGDELQEMRGWPCESHWIGCGTVGTRTGNAWSR